MTITDLIASLAPADRTIVIVVVLVLGFLFAKALLHALVVLVRGYSPAEPEFDGEEVAEPIVTALRDATTDLLGALGTLDDTAERIAVAVEYVAEREREAEEDEREATRLAQVSAYTRMGEILEGFDDDLAAQMAARSAARSSDPRPLDEVSIATLTFLREHAALRFTALSISENLDGDVTNEQVGSRLATLAGRGLVLQHKREGKQALWQAAPERNGEAAS